MRIRRSGLALWKKWTVIMIFVRFCELQGDDMESRQVFMCHGR